MMLGRAHRRAGIGSTPAASEFGNAARHEPDVECGTEQVVADEDFSLVTPNFPFFRKLETQREDVTASVRLGPDGNATRRDERPKHELCEESHAAT